MHNDDLPDWYKTLAACIVLALFTVFCLIWLGWFAQRIGLI